MVRDNWNFHGDIATNLEMISRSMLQITKDGMPVRPAYADNPDFEIYDADLIEGGTFFEVMKNLLIIKYGNDNNKVNSFISENNRLNNLRGHELIELMGKDGIQIVYDDFLALIND